MFSSIRLKPTKTDRQPSPVLSRSGFQMLAGQFALYKKTIEVAKKMFSKEKIWPDQCDYLIYQFQNMATSISRLAKLFSAKPKTAGVKAAFERYSFVVKTSYLQSEVEILILALQEYRDGTPEGRSGHKEMHRQLREVDSKLMELLSELEVVTQSQKMI